MYMLVIRGRQTSMQVFLLRKQPSRFFLFFSFLFYSSAHEYEHADSLPGGTRQHNNVIPSLWAMYRI